MKKILSAVAAFGLVAGMAASASALELSVSGYYEVDGFMMSPANGEGVDPTVDKGTDSFWAQTFVVKPQLKVNDKITMFSQLRFDYDSVWGTGDTGASAADDSNRHLDIYHLYMEYMSPVGKIRVGRVSTGAWGGDFISSEQPGDRLMWWPSFIPEPFSLCLFTQKSVEYDGPYGDYASDSDADNDTYEIDLTYKVEDLMLRVAYDYNNYKSDPTYDRNDSRLKAYGVAKIGVVDLEAEWGWQFGTYRDYDDSALQDRDVDAMAFMVDASTTMDKLNVGLMYFWAEGQSDTSSDADMEAAMRGTLSKGTGYDFNPYYILTGDWTGMLDGENVGGPDDAMAYSGVNCIGVHADYQVSDQLSLHGAVAYAWADDTAMVEAIADKSIDDEYGWEVDLGAKYKLLDNLTYEVHAAYFNAGDFFDDITKAYNDAEGTSYDSGDVYLLSNHLVMTF